MALGRAAAQVFDTDHFVIGRDTRVSGPMLEAALTAGLTSAGANVTLLGVCPTPAVAWVAARDGIAGAMISASHNPFGDNGIKLFSAGGTKLSDAVQDELERALGTAEQRPAGADVGRVDRAPHLVDAYAESVIASIDGRSLAGLRVVVDTANGSAHAVGPTTLRALGAEVTVLADAPDGVNINDNCGSTHLDGLAQAVRASGADLGLAFDGDADRLLAVDGDGESIDGDQLIAICAIDRKARGVLADDTVVVTVMSNLGFRLGMVEHGIRVHETSVGDRYVLEALEANGWSLGGEQSGHLIFHDLATTGDGLLTAVQVLDLLARSGRSLRSLADDAMQRLPQVLENVRVDERDPALITAIEPDVRAVEDELGERGRVLIRASGTEPLVRVMVEAPARDIAQSAADRLVAAVRAAQS